MNFDSSFRTLVILCGLWWFTVDFGCSLWTLVVHCGLWLFTVDFGGLLWTLVVHCGLRWFNVDFGSYEFFSSKIMTGPEGLQRCSRRTVLFLVPPENKFG